MDMMAITLCWKFIILGLSYQIIGVSCSIHMHTRKSITGTLPYRGRGRFSSHPVPTFVWLSKIGSFLSRDSHPKQHVQIYQSSARHGQGKRSIRTLEHMNSNINTAPQGSPSPKLYYTVSTLLIIAAITVWKRDIILSFDFKQFLNQNLEKLSSLGPLGIALYSIALLVWEMTVGVTTPVETAAGMAFGFTRGAIANGIGKIGGSLLAFALGRFILRDFVTRKLQGNEYLDLIQRSIRKDPIRVALIWRFSPLPEFIKNFGLAVTCLNMSHFATAVLLHGLPFTLLWTFMGHEMGLVVRGVSSKPSIILKVLVGCVYVFGFVISPTLVGLFIKGLRDEQKLNSHKN